jgi:hypothetical protein
MKTHIVAIDFDPWIHRITIRRSPARPDWNGRIRTYHQTTRRTLALMNRLRDWKWSQDSHGCHLKRQIAG